MSDATTVDLDALRERVGTEPCSDCGDPSETLMVNDRTVRDGRVFVCYPCWSERHRRRARTLKDDRREGRSAMKRFHGKMARAFRSVGDDENADIAARLAR